MKSIVLLSGGLDSTVNVKLAARDTEIQRVLTFDYGHRAGWCETRAAEAIAKQLGLPHEVVRLDWLADITKSALVDIDKPLPHPDPTDLDDAAKCAFTAKAVWVPNRNGIFLNVAAAYAETYGCELIITGFNKEEAASFPDNSSEYLDAVNASLALSTQDKPSVRSYTVDLDKRQIVNLGREIGAPIELVWSCYEGGDAHCWHCESCLRFKRALSETGHWEWYEQQAGAAATA